MSKLDAAQRNMLAKSDFAVPSRAPGSGSYPINDASHARNALSRASGKPVQGQVDAAVHRKFPGIGAKVQGRSGQSLEHMASRMHPGAK